MLCSLSRQGEREGSPRDTRRQGKASGAEARRSEGNGAEGGGDARAELVISGLGQLGSGIVREGTEGQPSQSRERAAEALAFNLEKNFEASASRVSLI